MATTSTQRMREMRARRREGHRCIDCSAETYSLRCDTCADIHRRRDRARRLYRNSKGFCEFCGRDTLEGRLCRACTFIDVVRRLLVHPYVNKKTVIVMPCHGLWSQEYFWHLQQNHAWELYVGGYWGNVLADNYSSEDKARISAWLATLGVPPTGFPDEAQLTQLAAIVANNDEYPTIDQLMAAINNIRSTQCESTPPQL